MENGTDINRNHIDLKWTDVPFEAQSHPVPAMGKIAKFSHAHSNSPSRTNAKCSDKAKLVEERVKVRNKYTTQSGHILKPATRPIAQM